MEFKHIENGSLHLCPSGLGISFTLHQQKKLAMPGMAMVRYWLHGVARLCEESRYCRDVPGAEAYSGFSSDPQRGWLGRY